MYPSVSPSVHRNLRSFALAAAVAVTLATSVAAQPVLKAPQSGETYREYVHLATLNGVNWRVTDPNATFTSPNGEPADFLPNPTHVLGNLDLAQAVRAEALLDAWGGHVGTTGKQIRFNGNSFQNLPDILGTPGAPQCYTHQYNPVVPIQLSHLQGTGNNFAATADDQTCFSFNWGQWGLYMTVLRVYYDSSTKAHPTGAITSHSAGGTISENATIACNPSGGSGGIARVEYFAYYDGYDTDGDGVYQQYHESYSRTRTQSGKVTRNHVGTATSAPWQVQWDTTLVPDQAPGSVKLVARIQDNAGIWHVTPEVTGLTLTRSGSVKLYKPTNVPQRMWTRDFAGNNDGVQCNVTIPASDDLGDAEAAYLLVRTWNGIDGQAEPGEDHFTRVNGVSIGDFGEDHFYSYDVIPISPGLLNSNSSPNNNVISFLSESTHHGVEILWPGPAVIVRYSSGTPATAPVVPTGLAASAVSSTMAQLNWNANSEGDLASYSLFRSTTSGFTPMATNRVASGLTGTATTDSGLFPDTTYYYKLTAVATSGLESAPTGQVMITTPPGMAPPMDPIAHWSFETGSGSVVDDVSGNGNFGAMLGSTWGTDTPDESGYSACFDGVNDAVAVGSMNVPGNALTLSAWFKADTFNVGDGRIISKASSVQTAGHVYMLSTLRVGSSYRLRCRLRTGSTTRTLIATSGNLQLDTWTLATMTYDGSTLRLFKDGVQVGSMSLTGTIPTMPSVQTAIGNQAAGAGSRPFDGCIDDVRVYARALSAAEVAELLPAPTMPHAPEALADSYDAQQDTVLSVSAPGVLGNDMDVDGDMLQAQLAMGASFGSVNLASDGSFTYMPSPGYFGPDEFTYTATDGSLSSAPVTVSLSVMQVVTPTEPFVAIDDDYMTVEDMLLTVSTAQGVLGNDLAPEGLPQPTVSAALVEDVQFGQLSLQPDGSFMYMPALDYAGSDYFTYQVDNGALSNIAMVMITVTPRGSGGGGDEPGLVAHWRFDEGSGSNAADAVGSRDATHAAATWGGASVDGSSSYAILDGVDDVILLPTFGVAGNQLTLACWFRADDFGQLDGRLISKATGVQGNEHEWMLSTMRVPYSSASGTMYLRFRVRTGNSTTTLVATSGALTPNVWVHATAVYDGTTMRLYKDGMLVGSTAKSGDLNVAPGVGVAIGNQPPGADQRPFDGCIDDVRIYDKALTAGEIEALAMVTAPPPVNQAPVGTPDSYSLMESDSLTVPAPGVLANDTDPELDPLTAVLVDDVAHGALALQADGSFTYVPAAGFSGADSFSYRAFDGLDSSAVTIVTFDVDALPEPPPGDGLLHHWMFDDESGDVAVDSAGTQDGLLQGATFSNDTVLPGTSVLLDGEDDRVDLGAVDVSGNALTIAAWFKADDYDVLDGRIVSKATGVSSADHYWMMSSIRVPHSNPNGRHYLRFRLKTNGETSTLIGDAAAGRIHVGNWTHGAMVYDGAEMRIYKDGVLVGSMPKTGALDTNPAVDAAIGNQPSGAGERPWDGRLDDVRIYNRALTPAEIAELVQ